MSATVRTFPRSSRTRYPMIVRAEGVYLYDADGKRYLDASSGAVVANIGHGRAEVAEAAAAQLRAVAFVHGSQFTTHVGDALSERLGEWLPEGVWRFFATSGGSEATEAAIKLARQYQVERGRRERTRILTRRTAYHGASLGALAASGLSERRALYAPLVHEYAFPKIDKPDPCAPLEGQVAALHDAIAQLGADTIAAVMVEPVMGASDPALAPPAGYYQQLRSLCDEHDIVFIADEVMCGLGRAGKKLGLDHWGVVPDVVVLGKGLGAGYAPLGGIVVRERLHDALAQGSGSFQHGYTYAGHPGAAAVGKRVLRILREEGLVQRSAEMGAYLLAGLRDLQGEQPLLRRVRGYGLLLGVALAAPGSGEAFARPGFAYALGDRARARGLNLYPGTGSIDGTRGDHLLIAPPLTVTRAEADELLELLGLALDDAEEDVRRFDT